MLSLGITVSEVLNRKVNQASSAGCRQGMTPDVGIRVALPIHGAGGSAVLRTVRCRLPTNIPGRQDRQQYVKCY